MRGRIEGIDLLRGIAVGLVMLRHAWPEVFPGAGVVGVVMFFALSGYLITGLLVDELDRTGRVDLRRLGERREPMHRRDERRGLHGQVSRQRAPSRALESVDK